VLSPHPLGILKAGLLALASRIQTGWGIETRLLHPPSRR
jgi:hypothetical protein